MAVLNPNFDPNKPYDEMIIWKPEGLAKLISMDETDVRTDQTKRGRSLAARSVKAHTPGSRRGHRDASRGKQPKSSKKKGGFAKGSKERKTSGDQGAALATKSAAKNSWAGGTLGNGKSVSPYIMADHPIEQGVLDAAPVGTAMHHGTGLPIPAAWNINKSGGMETDDMPIYVDRLAVPATGVTPTNRGMFAMDGLGQHHSYKTVKKCDEVGLDIALRFPHGSSRNQHEDFAHFAIFGPEHEQAKKAAQVVQFQAARAKAAEQGREPTRQELMAAAVLDEVASARAARRPWMEAFSEERVKKGWADEGVVPFTRKLMWDLRAEEAAKGITPSNVPPAANAVAAFGVAAPTPLLTTGEAGPSSALVLVAPQPLAISAAPAQAWDARIDEEVEQLLRAEVGDPSLNVPPVPPPAKMPKLTSSLLFKLPDGGASGPTGKALVRAKEVERRLGLARAEYRKGRREEKTAAKADGDWAAAAEGLALLEANKFDLKALQKKHLLGLVRSLNVGKATGNNDALRGLLTERFGSISRDQFVEISATVQRGLAVALLPAPPAAPPALPQPAEPAPEQPLALLPPVDDGTERISARLKRRRA